MCGILVHKGQGDNSKIFFRGQDFTSSVEREGYHFVHNLLSVTGEFTTQPFIDEENQIICLYNGEIYNHSFTKSDGENIIPLYKKYGEKFASYLDGEYAIALYDFKKRIAIFVTDPFGTKPLYVKGAECGSYRSGVNGDKMKPNRIRVQSLDRDTFKEDIVVEWDWQNQSKRTYDDWIKAFENSIRKRAKDDCFIGLSSGYDSGAIACELLKQKIQFKAYCFKGSENENILSQRQSMLKEWDWFVPSLEAKKLLKQRIDNERYTIIYDGKPTHLMALDEEGIYGVATMCMLANKEGRKIILSGQGADEILSDYALFPSQSEFKGKFPSNLYMWKNFQGSCQESYLMKEEFGGGAFNIETRYPFLDKELVQEFLWLSPELKNRKYKAPLHEYLSRNNYPFEEGKKIGFNINMRNIPAVPEKPASIVLSTISTTDKPKKILLITGDTIAPWAITFRANELKKRWINDEVTIVDRFSGTPKNYDIIHILFSAEIGIKYGNMIAAHPNTVYTSVVGANTLECAFDKKETLYNVYRNSKKVVCLNNNIRNELLKLIGHDQSDKVFFIPNGVDEKLFDRQFVVGFVGSNLNHEYKGLNLIKDACDKLGVQLLLNDHHFPDKIVPRERMPDFYNKIDCLCIASLGEGTNNPTLEALAMNKPVVSTRTGIAEELEGVILVDRTVESIMDGIRKVYTRKQILEKYTWDKIAQQYYNLYT